MKAEDLKTGFFGYQKASVYQYITTLEEQFSAKLMEQDAAHKAETEQHVQKIRQLEEELDRLYQRYESQREEQAVIANTLLDAQRYADTLRKQTDQREEQARQHLAEVLAACEAELEGYSTRIERLRSVFSSLLSEMDRSVAQAACQVEETAQHRPDENLSLFRRKAELGA